MDLLLILILILAAFAIFGGLTIHPLLFLVLALVVVLVVYSGRGRWR